MLTLEGLAMNTSKMGMRQIFISEIQAGMTEPLTIDGAEEHFAPWAAEIITVEGGFMAFESSSDAETWRNQK